MEFKTKMDLEKKHKIYDERKEFWKFLELAYEGGPEFLKAVITKNSRESENNYQERLAEAICFNYSQSIVDLFNFYLTEKSVDRKFKDLEKDPLFSMFLKNVDLNGTNYNVFVNDLQKAASVTGAVGLLVDKPRSQYSTTAEHIKYGIYPYCAVYTLLNIYDWEITVDPLTGKPVLSYLKLKEADGNYYVWYRDRWELWSDGKDDNSPVQRIDWSPHNLGEIPFMWVQNIKSIINPLHGKSDISEIAYVVGSIARNLSCGDEIIKFAGFPILRMPYETDEEGNNKEQAVGIRNVLGFDPDMGEAGKSDWLESEVLEPIDATLKWTDRKVDEIYRVAHLSGVHGQRKSNNEVSSGLALRYEFQQLTSVLAKKAENITETEYELVRFWTKWQKQEGLFKQVEIKWDKNYNIEDLSVSIENTLKVVDKVRSPLFARLAERKLVNQELPNISDDDRDKVIKEIDTMEEKQPELNQQFKSASNLGGSK